ncbi:hypothetical protein scyTo_0025764 [Scyliorhinus torazame]|uniref:Uncharacterized protein n=1 Tax=Scyliorhinus torazame TaxID=75743 RepID=A0A401QHZ3_SCYTO|nr:hypothetical protein [Scyliorhinus torazame]
MVDDELECKNGDGDQDIAEKKEYEEVFGIMEDKKVKETQQEVPENRNHQWQNNGCRGQGELDAKGLEGK